MKKQPCDLSPEAECNTETVKDHRQSGNATCSQQFGVVRLDCNGVLPAVHYQGSIGASYSRMVSQSGLGFNLPT